MRVLVPLWVLQRWRGCRPRAGLPLIFGVLIGILLGICLNFDHESDVDHSLHLTVRESALGAQQRTIYAFQRRIWLRCAILVQPTTDNPQKYIQAAADTYTKKCNETIYFVHSQALLEKFAGTLTIFLIENLNPARWSFFADAVKFISKLPLKDNSGNTTIMFTAFVNEETYMVIDNLLALISLNAYTNRDPIIIGRLSNIKSPLTFLFPLSQTRAFSMESGIILSQVAMDLILSDSQCLSTGWFIPQFTGKALLKCADRVGASVWDPVDEDGHHLFITSNLRQFFSKPHSSLAFLRGPLQSITTSDKESGSQPVIAECCSHRAIAFGSLSYRDMRVLHFTINNMRVFGI
ncbi:hypothetical protein Ddc_07744 [Ditylenchus destructor]|nr:hypothetical protein Ddc_07744 [Ditylenchus destructor]